MDYSKQNNEKKAQENPFNAAKSKKKITFNIFVSQCLLFCSLLLVSLLPSVASRGSSTVHLHYRQQCDAE